MNIHASIVKNVVNATTVISAISNLGVPLIDGGTVRLPQLIGFSRAMDMILTGRPVEAKEALQFGLANKICPKGAGNIFIFKSK